VSRLRGRIADPCVRRTRGRLHALKAAAGMALLLAGLAGCETDSFLDPSITGRWEHTPTTVPILERIAAIEDPRGELVEYMEPTSDDLRVDADDYRVGPGDAIDLVLYDMIVPAPARRVSARRRLTRQHRPSAARLDQRQRPHRR
jgi:polysaccharide export outer membrane protein